MKFQIILLALFSIFLTSPPVLAADGKLAHVVRFTDYQQGSIDDWLLGKGFKFQRDADNRDQIETLGLTWQPLISLAAIILGKIQT